MPGWWRARAGLAALGLLALALGAWFSLPRSSDTEPRLPGVRVVVLDASASAVRTRRGLAGVYLHLVDMESRAARATGQELAVVRCAPEVQRLFGPGSIDAWSAHARSGTWQPLVPRGEDLATPLDRAVAVAEGWLREPGRAPGELVLVGDRRFDGPDPSARILGLVRDGVSVRQLELPAPMVDDISLVELRGPAHVALGSTLAVSLRWRLRGPQSEPAWARFTLTGPGETRHLERTLAHGESVAALGESPAQRARFDLGELEEGLWSVHVELGIGVADRSPEDDSGRLHVRVGQRPVIGVVVESEQGAILRGAWTRKAPRGLQFDWCDPSHMAERLPHWDAVLTVDMGPGQLAGSGLENFVREGGGWLAMGGTGLLDGWSDSPLGSLLPLEPRTEDQEPRDVILLVDGSGSMNEPENGGRSRWDRVRDAVLGLVPSVPAGDRVQLWFFTGDLVRPLLFDSESAQGESERLAALSKLMAVRAPGGNTDIVFSLHHFIEDREAIRHGPRRALVVLLSDGYQTSFSHRQPQELRLRLAATGADLALIGIGERPNLSILSGLLLEGESVLPAGDLSDLERMLVEEIFAERVRRDLGMQAQLAPVESLAAEGLGASLVSAWKRSGAFPCQPLRGYLRAVRNELPERHAEVLAFGMEGEPLLAIGRAGLGRTACMTSLPASQWAPCLGSDPQALAPLLQALAKGGMGRVERSAIRVQLEQGKLRLEDVPEHWPALLEGSFPGLGLQPVAFGPDPSSPDPRLARQAQAPSQLVGRSGGEQCMLVLTAQGREWGRLPLVLPVPKELSERGALLPASWPVAEAAKGQNLPATHPLGPWFLGFGLLAMAAAALVRPLGLRPGKP